MLEASCKYLQYRRGSHHTISTLSRFKFAGWKHCLQNYYWILAGRV